MHEKTRFSSWFEIFEITSFSIYSNRINIMRVECVYVCTQTTHTHTPEHVHPVSAARFAPTNHPRKHHFGDDIAPSSPFSPVLRSTLTPSTNHGHGDSKQIFGLLNFNEAHFRLPSRSPKLVAEWLVYK